MEFHDRILSLAAKAKSRREAMLTEEATKNALVMPFISDILGYDVFDPIEVVPEFTADVGVKKGEKIDYAIMRDGEVQILVECKKANGALRVEHASQLYRYFAVTNARIAVLTSGDVYHFYTDLDAPNRMDAKPFLVFDFNDIDESLIPELRKLTKESFDLQSVLSAAGELKYIGEIKRTLAAQFRDPDEDWIRFFTARVHDGAFTRKVRDQFAPLVAKAAAQYLNDQVNERLKTALGSGYSDAPEDGGAAPDVSGETASADAGPSRSDGIETTAEELEGFQIIKAIACSEVRPQRIVYRDAKSYFAVLLDDNNRRPLARLHFNGKSRKYIGLFDAERNETRHLLSSVEDVYLHAEAIRASARAHRD